MTHPSSNFLEIPPSITRPRPHISRNLFFSWKSHSRCLRALYKKLENATTTSTFSVSTFNIQFYFEQIFSMANYKRATGEAQTSNFVTLSSKEFYSNQRESFRLCVTAVRGTPKLNLTKFWFNSEKGMWLPTGKNFYFSKEAGRV